MKSSLLGCSFLSVFKSIWHIWPQAEHARECVHLHWTTSPSSFLSKSFSCPSRGAVLRMAYYQPLPGIPHTSTPWLCLWSLYFVKPSLVYTPPTTHTQSAGCKCQIAKTRRDGKSLWIHRMGKNCQSLVTLNVGGIEQLRLSWVAGEMQNMASVLRHGLEISYIIKHTATMQLSLYSLCIYRGEIKTCSHKACSQCV